MIVPILCSQGELWLQPASLRLSPLLTLVRSLVTLALIIVVYRNQKQWLFQCCRQHVRSLQIWVVAALFVQIPRRRVPEECTGIWARSYDRVAYGRKL